MFWRLLDRFNDLMEAIFFVSYLGLMLVIGWNLFDDDRILFILIVLYVVVVGGTYFWLKRNRILEAIHPALRVVLLVQFQPRRSVPFLILSLPTPLPSPQTL